MRTRDVAARHHDHTFEQDRKRPGEARTLLVIAITATMMVVEIAAGAIFGSMALLADGLHMASHAAALSISAFAYIYARRRARDERFSFGTGKVNALGGFTGAVLLAVFAVLMAWESVTRLIYPVAIRFDQAILVAILGLLVNGASVLILGHREPGGDGSRDRAPGGVHDHGHDHPGAGGRGDARHGDHNLRAAYLHVLADTVTSLLAIVALLAGKYYGLAFLDPVMGIVGAVLVTRWSLGLLRATSQVLLDREGPAWIRRAIRESIEANRAARVTDLHLWSIGPGIWAVEVSLVASDPLPPPCYKERLPGGLGLVHVTVEVHPEPPEVSCS